MTGGQRGVAVAVVARLGECDLAPRSRPARRLGWLPSTCALASGVFLALSAAAAPVTLRNCLDPALLTHHDLTITLARKVRRAGISEESSIEVKGSRVRAHLSESQPGRVKVADMLLTEAAKVIALFRDGKPVTPLPGPEVFGLPPRGALQFNTREQTVRDGPADAPAVRAAEDVLLSVLLDAAHWPKSTVEVGHRWTRPVEGEAFRGVQRFEFTGLAKVGDENAAVISMTLDGQFVGRFADKYELKEARARFVWIRGERVLSRLEAAASYVRRRRDRDDPYALKAVMALRSRQRLSDEQKSDLRRSLGDFAELLGQYQSRKWSAASASARLFAEGFADGPWRPAAEWIERQCAEQLASARKLRAEELKKTLAELVVRWEAATADDDDDLIERTRAAYRQLLARHSADIRALLSGADDNIRAIAVFAWAFGGSLEHGDAVARAARDRAPRVRAWAANGLAAIGDPDTDPELLRKLLADDDAEVRARACQAVAACNPPGEPLAGRTRDGVLALLEDVQRRTRYEAARTLGAIGSAVDLAALERAQASERDAGVQEALEQAAAAIRRRGAK